MSLQSISSVSCHVSTSAVPHNHGTSQLTQQAQRRTQCQATELLLSASDGRQTCQSKRTVTTGWKSILANICINTVRFVRYYPRDLFRQDILERF